MKIYGINSIYDIAFGRNVSPPAKLSRSPQSHRLIIKRVSVKRVLVVAILPTSKTKQLAAGFLSTYLVSADPPS